ncbi:hypothetical protein EOM57_00995 [Candidatus Saccharibacteria bacterium]|nr:hypothetical protein [Candidatus Saccharibacteria bacterium]
MEFKVTLCADDKLLSAINSLASALGGGKVTAITDIDPTSLSDADTAENIEDKEKYTMFQDMAKAANRLQEADAGVYEKILHKYVPKGKKYSAVKAADWGKATKEFIKAFKDLSQKVEEDEEEESNIATEIMYYVDLDDNLGITKKGEEIKEDVEYITKAAYLKKKKALEAAAEEADDFEDDAPRLSVNELRALASKAANMDIKVGSILNKIGKTSKISALDPSCYNDVEDAIREAMKELED